VIKRRQAVIGYVTYRIARRLARREVGGRVRGLSPGADRPDQGGSMFKNNKGTATAAAVRAAALVETVRPIVTRAMNDPDLHEALRNAFQTGREVQGEISGKPPKKAAKRIAQDRKLQKRVEASATDLQKAVSSLVEPQRTKGRVRRTVARIAVVGAVAGGVVVVLRKLRGGGDDPVV
jgi:hypothetical protein